MNKKEGSASDLRVGFISCLITSSYTFRVVIIEACLKRSNRDFLFSVFSLFPATVPSNSHWIRSCFQPFTSCRPAPPSLRIGGIFAVTVVHGHFVTGERWDSERGGSWQAHTQKVCPAALYQRRCGEIWRPKSVVYPFRYLLQLFEFLWFRK